MDDVARVDLSVVVPLYNEKENLADLHRQLVQAHAWAAAHGLRGSGLHPVTGEEITAERLVQLLLAQAAPGLEESGDLPQAEQMLRRLIAEGDGASRQRAVHERRGRLRRQRRHVGPGHRRQRALDRQRDR